ncbi:MAG TPA: hypothetical protein VGT44_17055, partial [Ktedonobacteraceae bacterium]|nr:hypothetical protein [Ktedonobacteraceae bacterium]
SAVSGFSRQWRTSSDQARTDAQRREVVRQAARLMILGGLGLTLLAFVTSPPASASTPWTSARYLVGFLIALPALLFPLWEMGRNVKNGRIWIDRLKSGLRVALLLLIFAASLLGTIDTFATQLSLSRASFSRVNGLIGGLLQLGATHIYANSDDCTRIAFLSDERVICAVLDQGLNPGLDRYFPYRAQVASWPQPFYVFLEGSPQAVLFQIKAAQQHIAYSTFKINGYDVFEPSRRVLP